MNTTLRQRLSNGFDHRPVQFHLGLLVLATALPLLILSYIIYGVLVDSERKSVRQGLFANAGTLATLVDTEISTSASFAAALAQSPSLQSGNLAAFYSEARKALEFLPGSWVAVTSPDGKVLLNTELPLDTPPRQHMAPDMLAQGFKTGRYQVSDIMKGRGTGRLLAVIEMPVFRDGKPLYSLGVILAPARFLALLEARFKQGEIVAIVDRQMKFVARIPDHENRVGTLASEGWRAAMLREPEGWLENTSVEGLDIVTGYTRTAHGWSVGIARIKSDLEKPLLDLLWWTGLISLALIGLSLLLSWWLGRRASICMKELAEAARALGEGRPMGAVRLLFAEARVISHALASASGRIDAHNLELAKINSGLEAQVAERTRDLVAEMRQREEAEATLRQTHKMEAIGQLTGGIAHDFNNMLTIVIGNLDTIKRRLSSAGELGDRLTGPVESALKGARNAAKLTHRLLAFARQQPLAPSSVDLRILVAGMADMLARTVGEKIRIETVAGAGLWSVLADENQLESALLNLVVNARDAMPDGGLITIETSNAYLDEAYVSKVADIKPGQYAMLCVSDTGHGIPADKMSRIFEPFFTTKETGKGTGLGLAMVHGFVKQSDGHIRIYSEVGQGTAVKIYLPRMKAGLASARPEVEDLRERFAVTAVAGEAILLVEDDDGVRGYAASVLEDLGYVVRVASGSDEALVIARSRERIDLMFTDVVLGGKLNGRQLADEIATIRPDLPVLFTTGYTRNAIVHHGRLDEGVELLTKPYASTELAEKIRRMLDHRQPANGV